MKSRQLDLIGIIGHTMQRFKPSDYELFTAACRLLAELSTDGTIHFPFAQAQSAIARLRDKAMECMVLCYCSSLVEEGTLYRQQTDRQTLSSSAARTKWQTLRWLKLHNRPFGHWTFCPMQVRILDRILTVSAYNVSLMKSLGLKYILQEIECNPSTTQIGTKLIIPRRLKQIKWNEVSISAPAED